MKKPLSNNYISKHLNKKELNVLQRENGKTDNGNHGRATGKNTLGLIKKKKKECH
jgi:hypothetical protein